MLTSREKAALCAYVHAEEFPVHTHTFRSLSVQWAVILQPYRVVGRNWYGGLEPCLIFPGSKTIHDWIYNTRIFPEKSPTGPGHVHAGFLTIAREIWPQLKRSFMQYRIRHVMGYSLGGPLAVLAAEILKDVTVTTFCSPRIGTAAWANRYPHHVYRHRISPDIVPGLIWPYQHVGDGVVLSSCADPVTAHRYALQTFMERGPNHA